MIEFPQTSETLINGVRNSDDGVSWAEFIRIYEPVVFRMARRRGIQEADTQDIIQHVFLSVFRSLDKWQHRPDGPPFRAWLSTIARNAITNSLVRRSPDRGSGSTSVLERLTNISDNCDTDAEVARETQQECVLRAVELIRHEFSDEVWLSFERTAVAGETVAEVARSQGRTAGSIYVARFRVIARLKEKVQELSLTWNPGESDNDRRTIHNMPE
ncbi:MAG: sigma-70 family RNA polymerase sigma factor [Planctomycetaceae bacterium]|nr:sigma-70 family RNA polymerase sigma factor [Planctomycetaceae bacterium]